MYVVFTCTPPLLCVVHAGDSERPLNKLTRAWCGSCVASAGGRLVLPTTHAALARSVPADGPGSPAVASGEGNEQHEGTILAMYPVSLVLSKILQSVKWKGSRPLKLQLKYLQKR